MTKTLKDHVFDAAPEFVRRFLFKTRQARRLSNVEFQALLRQFGKDTRARARYCHDRFVCRVIFDPDLVLMIKKLQGDFRLLSFVETGTYDGETSIAMSLLFERVLTCDVKDGKRRLESYYARNVVYETKSSQDIHRAVG